MKKFIVVFLFLCLLYSSRIYGQSGNESNLIDAVDSLIATQFKPNEPGISVLIANKNGVVYKRAFGSANIELNVPMHPDMIFRIGYYTRKKCRMDKSELKYERTTMHCRGGAGC